MGDKTKIEWADATWNPTVGCMKVSAGCDHCYAEGVVNRFAGTPAFPHRFDTVTLRPQLLDKPLHWQKPRRIFVNSLSDLFHKDIPDDYIARVWAVMALAPQHVFQVLTKRHGRMRSLLSSSAFRVRVLDAAYRMAVGEDADVTVPRLVADAYRQRVTLTLAVSRVPGVDVESALPWPLPNVWLGVSAESQAAADLRIPALLDTPAEVRFLSCEPLLGPVDLTAYLPEAVPYEDPREAEHGVDWVIVGGESGRGARPMHPAWPRRLRDDCVAAGVPFHYKQAGEWTPTVRLGNPDGTGVRDPWAEREPDAWVRAEDGLVGTETDAMRGGSWCGVYRVGKRAAGRVLDGETWDEQPTVKAGA